MNGSDLRALCNCRYFYFASLYIQICIHTPSISGSSAHAHIQNQQASLLTVQKKYERKITHNSMYCIRCKIEMIVGKISRSTI